MIFQAKTQDKIFPIELGPRGGKQQEQPNPEHTSCEAGHAELQEQEEQDGEQDPGQHQQQEGLL